MLEISGLVYGHQMLEIRMLEINVRDQWLGIWTPHVRDQNVRDQC